MTPGRKGASSRRRTPRPETEAGTAELPTATEKSGASAEPEDFQEKTGEGTAPLPGEEWALEPGGKADVAEEGEALPFTGSPAAAKRKKK
jgi:hypothetical protein